jgi:hypothetical protein
MDDGLPQPSAADVTILDLVFIPNLLFEAVHLQKLLCITRRPGGHGSAATCGGRKLKNPSLLLPVAR